MYEIKNEQMKKFCEILGLDYEKLVEEATKYNVKNNKDIKNFYNDYLNKKSDVLSQYKGFIMKNMENESGVHMTFYIPGVKKESVHVSFDERVCIVKSDVEVPYFGELNTKIKMKFDVDYEKTTCKMENGILEVFVYKVKNESKQININID